MLSRINFVGPLKYRLRSAADASRAVTVASARRTLHGRRRPGWNWYMEIGTEMLKQQVNGAFTRKTITEARKYLDAMRVRSAVLSEVNIEPLEEKKFRGAWFFGKHAPASTTLLYFH